MCAWSIGTAVALFVASIATGRIRGFTAFPAVIAQLSSGTAAAQNQSLSGLILRFVLPDRTAFPILPPPASTRLLIIAAQLAVLGLLVFLVRRVVLEEPLRSWAEFSVVLLVLPALQPFAWPHHWAWAVLAVPVCVHLCSRRLVRPAAAFAMALTFLLVTLFEFPLFKAANASAANPRLDPLLALGASLTLFGVLALALLVAFGPQRPAAPA
jgi:hypothetical protein